MSVAIINKEIILYRTGAEIECMVRNFESRLLPRASWTHEAHLTVALWYTLRHPWPEAVQRVSEGIKRYNAANGIVTTRASGYHETITLFWLRMVRRYLDSRPRRDCSLVSLANELITFYADKSLPLSFYTRERLMSAEARAAWVAPDLKTLPE